MDRSREGVGLHQFQFQFAARIRDPESAPLPEQVPERRMRVYEELVFNNIQGFLLACYPITSKLLGAGQWDVIVRHFISEHRCTSPLFRDIPREFLNWFGGGVNELCVALPFLRDFMHYEWLELAVTVAPDTLDLRQIDVDGDYVGGLPVLNQSVRVACYNYPVHLIGPDSQPQQPDDQRYCYLLYRDREDQVQFIQLNPVSARLVELLQQSEISGRDALLLIAAEIKHDDPDALVDMGRSQLDAFHQAGVLLGTRRGS